MKTFVALLVGVALLSTATGCCCSHLFGGGCGSPCGSPCGPCGYNSYYGGGQYYGAAPTYGNCPGGNCNIGPTSALPAGGMTYASYDPMATASIAPIAAHAGHAHTTVAYGAPLPTY
jgi:hypothetical protein